MACSGGEIVLIAAETLLNAEAINYSGSAKPQKKQREKSA